MIGIVVAAHGELAPVLIRTARGVLATRASVASVSIEEADDTASYEARLHEAVDTVRGDAGVLVITDMFGGTPSNVGMTLHEPGRVEVLTGVNLPMLIKAFQLCPQEHDLPTVAAKVKETGRQAIAVATEVLWGGQAEEAAT